jgi:hypothetical protein
MSRNAVCLLSFVVLLGLAPRAGAGLIAWWTLDEGTGTTVHDAGGNGLDGTFQGNPKWVEGVANGAVDFDGSSSIDFGTTPKLQLTTGITIACWIKPASFGGERGFCGRDGEYAFKSSGTQLRFTTPGILDHTGTTTTLQAGKWQHVAATFKPGQPEGLVFYIDGIEAQKLTASAMNAGTGPFRIGTNQWSEAYIGAIDEMRIYDRVLTAAQIKEVYDGGSPSFGKAGNPNPADGALAVGMPLLQWTAGENALFHSVYLGTSPDLTEANLIASRQVSVMAYYMAGLQPGSTYYWRVDEIEKDGVTVHTGDVWSFVAQGLTAYYPQPPDGSVDAPQTPVLTWQPGQLAIGHHLYFGTDANAVTQGSAEVDKGDLADPTFTPEALDSLTTYYWRVDETIAGGSLKAGPVWQFTTCLTVDNFESYTDEAGNCIFDVWIDGYATGLSGSMVGYGQAPFAEQQIVHGGLQSMPLEYNNVAAPYYSEAELDFGSAQDWTVDDAGMLVLYVRGQAGNAPAQLYVALEDASQHVAVATYPEPAITTTTQWTQWKVPLSSFTGVSLAKVRKLYLGVGDRDAPAAGGSGLLYIDDIGLTKP